MATKFIEKDYSYLELSEIKSILQAEKEWTRGDIITIGKLVYVEKPNRLGLQFKGVTMGVIVDDSLYKKEYIGTFQLCLAYPEIGPYSRTHDAYYLHVLSLTPYKCGTKVRQFAEDLKKARDNVISSALNKEKGPSEQKVHNQSSMLD